MHTITRILREQWDEYQNQQEHSILCKDSFRELMNADELPKRIRVTISTRSIRGAARVPVHLGRESWLDWNGRESTLFWPVLRYLKQIGVPKDTWTDIWVDWAPV